MYESMRRKVQTAAEEFADLLVRRIREANSAELIDGAVMNNIGDGIRMLHHSIATLERIERLNRNGNPDAPTGDIGLSA